MNNPILQIPHCVCAVSAENMILYAGLAFSIHELYGDLSMDVVRQAFKDGVINLNERLLLGMQDKE